MSTLKTSQLNLNSPAPVTQLDKLRRRLAIYQVNLMSGFCPTQAEKQALRDRIRVVQNQIRLAELVQSKKSVNYE